MDDKYFLQQEDFMRDMLLNEKLDDYIQSFSAAFTKTLGEMEQFAYKNDFPIIGPQTGKLLYLLTKLKNPKSIFEMGSGYGYSTMWFALASPHDCEIHHTDTDEINGNTSREYFSRAGINRNIIYHLEDGIKALTGEGEKGKQFDIIFCDIDKEDYPRAFTVAKKYLANGGIFIADNILWKGQVADDAFAKDRATAAIKEASRIFIDDKDFFSSILSVRDGVLVSYKL